MFASMYIYIYIHTHVDTQRFTRKGAPSSRRRHLLGGTRKLSRRPTAGYSAEGGAVDWGCSGLGWYHIVN